MGPSSSNNWHLILQIVIIIIHSVLSECPPNWKLYKENCYFQIGVQLKRHDAEKICSSLGGGLALSYDLQTEQFLKQSFNTFQVKTCSDSDWIFYEPENECIYYHNVIKNYDDARSFCQSKGGDLVTIQDEQKNEFLTKKYLIEAGIPDLRFFIGGSDIDEEGEWKWVDGSPITYFNWDESYDEPNGGTDENCIEVINHSNDVRGKWNDHSCTNKYNFVCARPTTTGFPTWIGLKYDIKLQSYKWDNSKPLRFTHWDNNMFTNLSQVPCVYATTPGGLWKKGSCDMENYAICQIPNSVPPSAKAITDSSVILKTHGNVTLGIFIGFFICISAATIVMGYFNLDKIQTYFNSTSNEADQIIILDSEEEPENK